jgi:CheY-like chemotaxis protein
MEKAKKTVMIVDDDDDFLEELNEILKMSGYEVAAVKDPSKAIVVAKYVKPFVVLLDLKMPAQNGFQIAKELRLIPELRSVPIMAMTGYIKERPDSLLDLCGFSGWLEKPFYPLDLIAYIESVLNSNEVCCDAG